MDREFILRKLSDLMHWDEERDSREFPWLRLMSRLKFDGYQDFLAGIRFIESLVAWLQQFEEEDREAAYDFVRNRLVYIGPGEMQHLIELFYPEHVQPRLGRTVASAHGIKPYQVWNHEGARESFHRLRRKTIFIELSDGARIDVFRRVNAGTISHEQIYTAPRITVEKWDDMLKELRNDLQDASARFSVIYLVDDFTGSGTSLIRAAGGEWKGKLVRFSEDLRVLDGSLYFEEDWCLCVHHYLATRQAAEAIEDRHRAIRNEKQEKGERWFTSVEFSYGMTLPSEVRVDSSNPHPFLALVEKYYNSDIEAKRHNIEGGSEDIRYGYSKCHLPLVLDHNTPNNSLALLWAECGGQNGHSMRPLFRRRQRHT
jgi:hypothetical protein